MNVLLYGATGYTAQLIAGLAAESGVAPILGGRDPAGVAQAAARHGLPHRTFALDDAAAIEAGLDGITVVLNCAGPFRYTAAPIAEACIRLGAHYVDITGEIEIFEALHARDREARERGVMLLPGAGFDVVPSDCLAAHLKRRLPSATRLMLGIRGTGSLSRGTLSTAIEHIDRGGRVRKNGRIVAVPAAWKRRSIDFGQGPRPATTIPWGDVATAYYSTGIPDIEVYAAVTSGMQRMIRLSRGFGFLLGLRPVKSLLQRWVRSRVYGPNEEERRTRHSYVWGRVEDDAGRRATARITAPEGYLLTALTALRIVRRILDGDAPPGYQTPATAYGPDLILEIPGVRREELD